MPGEHNRAAAFAPASIGNVAVGFDLLGLAVAGVGDVVVAERVERQGVSIARISAEPGAESALALSTDAAQNTAGIAALELLADVDADFGVELHLHKGIPLASGMGSSAASAVASAVAVNALLARPLPHQQLLAVAMAGEAFASRAYHADNVAPSLLGGLVVCPAHALPRLERLRLPRGVISVLVHPDLKVETAASRATLQPDVSLQTATEQAGLLSQFLCACFADDANALSGVVRDVMIEPQRKAAVRGFDRVREAATAAGAFGASLSGSGPSVFALANAEHGEAVRDSMLAAFAEVGVAADGWISAGNCPGARLLDANEVPLSCR
ncbi:MAG: homoserine kinase [Pseudomonadota bacterium]